MAVTQSDKQIIKMTSQADALTGNYILHGLRVVASAGTAGDAFVVTETDGDEIFRSSCSGANFVDSIDLDCHPVTGITFASNTSNHGILYIYLE